MHAGVLTNWSNSIKSKMRQYSPPDCCFSHILIRNWPACLKQEITLTEIVCHWTESALYANCERWNPLPTKHICHNSSWCLASCVLIETAFVGLNDESDTRHSANFKTVMTLTWNKLLCVTWIFPWQILSVLKMGNIFQSTPWEHWYYVYCCSKQSRSQGWSTKSKN